MVYNEINRRTIDQTIVSPDITTLLKQKTLPPSNSTRKISEPNSNQKKMLQLVSANCVSQK
jgi:hypothetical protein